MSSGNKVLSRGENPLGMFVKDNVLRTHQPVNPQGCRRRMRTKQQGLQANGVAMSEANSLVGSLSVPAGKCQTTTIIHRTARWPYYGTSGKWKSPLVTCLFRTIEKIHFTLTKNLVVITSARMVLIGRDLCKTLSSNDLSPASR